MPNEAPTHTQPCTCPLCCPGKWAINHAMRETAPASPTAQSELPELDVTHEEYEMARGLVTRWSNHDLAARYCRERHLRLALADAAMQRDRAESAEAANRKLRDALEAVQRHFGIVYGTSMHRSAVYSIIETALAAHPQDGKDGEK